MIVKPWLRRLSLKFRLTALSVGLFVTFIWALVLISATVLQNRLQQLLADQQLAATRQTARELDRKLQDDIDGLTRAAAGLPRELSYATLQPLLSQYPLMHVAFSAGLMVIGLDGKAIADYPVLGRRNTYYGDRDWFRQVVASGKPYIDKPIMGRALSRPVLSMAVPVLDAGSRVRAVLIGGIDLTAPNFLGFVSDPALTGDNQFFVFSPRDHLLIAATDPKRVMTRLPERGRNLLFDRMFDGSEGSGIAFSSEGIQKLYSGQQVPTAGWVILAGMPTEIAFGPVRTMQHYLYGFAALLTLVAVLVIGFMVRRVLAPLEDATRAIAQMTGKSIDLTPLPVQRSDEIGALVGKFNQLVVDTLEYQQALSESEHLFRLLVESAPDAIFVQARGRFAYANNMTLKLFGATQKEQLLGQPILERIHPDCRALIAERIRRANEGQDVNSAIEETYLRLDGTSVAVEVSAVPVRYGEENGALVFARDIDDKKCVAVELERHRNHLEELVAERTVQLAEAKQAAEAAARAKSEFLANMSHEIRTPLGIILGLGGILRQKTHDPALEQRLAQLCGTADHLAAVVNDILDLSKIDAGHLALDENDFCLGAILDKVTSLIRELAREKGLTLAVEASPELREMLLHGDTLRLTQVLINLAGNAVKFTAHGSARLSVTALEESPDRVHLRFAVQDTGVGIAPADQTRLFGAFEQADNSATGTSGGTGLGLAISQKLVSLMGGSIHLDSQPGIGSTFSFELAFARAKGAAPTPVLASTAPNFAGARVLVADDHPINQEIILELLETLGCETEIAGDGAEAVECARANAYDLILMDLRMPRMDGIAATGAIRALPQHRNTPILAVTASGFKEDRQKCFDAGMNGYISKPFTRITLAAGLKQWLPCRADGPAETPAATDDALDRALAAIPGLDATCMFRRTAHLRSDYAALLRRYVDMQEHDMERLRGHLDGGNREAARDVAHQLKGISGFIGAPRIAALAAEIEAVLRADADAATVALLIASCAAELAGLATAVRAMPEATV